MLNGAHPKLVQSRDEINLNPARVGQAAFDILSRENDTQEVGETLEAMAPRYLKELFATIEQHKSSFDNIFYVVVLRKKEPWAVNVLRQWFIPRSTRPSPYVLRVDYPNHDHDVWQVNCKDSNITLEWTLPTAQDSLTILKNKEMYDSNLVNWIQLFNKGKLDASNQEVA